MQAGPMPSPNVDRAEISRFSRIAEQWWDPAGQFRPLHELNPVRLGYILTHTNVRSRQVLDVGCGGGILSEALAEAGAAVAALDASEESIRVAQLHLKESQLQIDYFCTTVEEFASGREEQYDIITCMEMLEHVPEPHSVVTACAQLTKPGGSLFFSTLNRTPKSWIMGIVGAEYLLKLLPRGTHQYQNFIRPSELNRWCNHAGMTMRNITGLHYNPLSKTFRTDPGVAVNYIVHCTKN